MAVGKSVGTGEGRLVGPIVGVVVGLTVGAFVGTLVGASWRRKLPLKTLLGSFVQPSFPCVLPFGRQPGFSKAPAISLRSFLEHSVNTDKKRFTG